MAPCMALCRLCWVFLFFFIIFVSRASKTGALSLTPQAAFGEITVAQSLFKDVAVMSLMQRWVLLNTSPPLVALVKEIGS